MVQWSRPLHLGRKKCLVVIARRIFDSWKHLQSLMVFELLLLILLLVARLYCMLTTRICALVLSLGSQKILCFKRFFVPFSALVLLMILSLPLAVSVVKIIDLLIFFLVVNSIR